jgi:hypothetical protein
MPEIICGILSISEPAAELTGSIVTLWLFWLSITITASVHILAPSPSAPVPGLWLWLELEVLVYVEELCWPLPIDALPLP